MTARASKPAQMACLTIGYTNFLMPADKAMKVAELMQAAFECEKDFGDHDFLYHPKEQPRVEFTFVKPKQVRQPAAAAAPRLLTER